MNLKHGPWLWHTCGKAQFQTMKVADRDSVPWQDIIAEMKITCAGVRVNWQVSQKAAFLHREVLQGMNEVCFPGAETWNL